MLARVGVGSVGACLRVALRPRLRTSDVRKLQDTLTASEKQHAVNSVVVHGVATGSDLGQLRGAPQASRAEHFEQMAALLRQLGESSLPVVIALDGNVSGSAVGLGAHASGCVVTERTRMSLPGPAFGYVPESFANYQLARLPRGLGAYLSLTGASLTGAEMVKLGLATHATEASALWRVEAGLGEQRSRHTGRALSAVAEACISPPDAESTLLDAVRVGRALAAHAASRACAHEPARARTRPPACISQRQRTARLAQRATVLPPPHPTPTPPHPTPSLPTEASPVLRAPPCAGARAVLHARDRAVLRGGDAGRDDRGARDWRD